MVERLRALLERPTDPALSRAILLLACSVSAGLAVLVSLGLLAPGGAGSAAGSDPAAPRISAPGGPARALRARPADERPGQDPQDRPGTSAHRRADRELAAHRALQHVPWRGDGAAIDLVGARGGRAVLLVRAATIAAARVGYRGFLRRYRDDGSSYLPRFRASGGVGG